MKKILVTGGTGYIGSHTAVELITSNFHPIIADNLSNSSKDVLYRIQKITNITPEFHEIDLCEKDKLETLFSKNNFDAVIHFAGLKAVGESVSNPLLYYKTNLTSTLNLIEIMQKYAVKNLVFSSSATVYGVPKSVPITEDFPLSATNPYGQTKLMLEQILKDFHLANPDFNIALLRYFNPAGAHPSGLIGENPKGIPNNLVPFVSQVAAGKLPMVKIFGNDYPTPDGTGVRDYIHVVDLACGHIAALNKLFQNPGLVVYNLGTGKGYSVLEVINEFKRASGKDVPFEYCPRRPGDVASCYADVHKAQNELGWNATKSLSDMCRDAWHWQQNYSK